MKSVFQMFKIGNGPSSSHTLGPYTISKQIFEQFGEESEKITVELVGDMAMTGKSFLTDAILLRSAKEYGVSEKFEVLWNYEEPVPIFDSNLMVWRVYLHEGSERPDIEREIFSVGGGELIEPKDEEKEKPYDPKSYSVDPKELVYSESQISQIIHICNNEKLSFWEYVYNRESDSESSSIPPNEFFLQVWKKMENFVERGINESKIGEILPDLPDEDLPEFHQGVGMLNIKRKGPELYKKARTMIVEDDTHHRNVLLSSYSMGVVEDSAFGEEVVTAPTFGSAGVVPAVLYHLKSEYGFSDEEISQALATCGLFGNIVKHNATLSGVLGGCIAEIGTASGMAAAGACQLLLLKNGEKNENDLEKIQYAAKVAREHHLGLNCCPVKGYVQVPCIERNAMGAIIAMDSANFSLMFEEIDECLESYDDLVYMTKI